MPTVRENILAAIATKLASAPSIGAPVYRSRVAPLARGECPAVIVEPVTDQADQFVVPKLDWKLTVRVSIMVRSETPDQSADTLVQNVHNKVMSDLTLGGYSYDIQPVSTSWDLLETDVPTGLISYDFLVLYRTSLQDLTVV
jgi:hypothetical protein